VDLGYLKRSARQFAYQLRKFYPEDETPINHYICKEHVLVLSSKRLYVYFCDQFIDYTGDYFGNIDILFIDDNKVELTIKGRVFKVEFEQENDNVLFKKYYVKYSE